MYNVLLFFFFFFFKQKTAYEITEGDWSSDVLFRSGFLAALVALVSGVRAGYRRTAWAVSGVAYVTWALAGRLAPHAGLAEPALGQIVLVGAWALVAIAVAEAARVRSAHFAEAMQARAERQRAAAEQQ